MFKLIQASLLSITSLVLMLSSLSASAATVNSDLPHYAVYQEEEAEAEEKCAEDDEACKEAKKKKAAESGEEEPDC